MKNNAVMELCQEKLSLIPWCTAAPLHDSRQKQKKIQNNLKWYIITQRFDLFYRILQKY